jgi:hypothetical protein
MKPAEFRPAEKYDTNPYYDTTEWPGYVEPTGTIEITENGEVDVTQYAKADVSVESSGGGSSDFTTAKIKLGSNATSSFSLPVSFIRHDALFSPIYSRDMDGETEYDVALYGGYAVIDVDENITIQNYTGNIEVQGHTLIISGDGTVTFTDGED